MSKLGDAVQNLLTKGLDAAVAIKTAELQVNDPTGYVTGPNGERVAIGQSAGGLAGAFGAVPPVVWIALVGVIGVVVVLPLLRK